MTSSGARIGKLAQATLCADARASGVLQERTNVHASRTDGAGNAASQSLTKQWVKLRQQLAEARATSQAKDAQMGRLEDRVQELQSELRRRSVGQAGATPLPADASWRHLGHDDCAHRHFFAAMLITRTRKLL